MSTEPPVGRFLAHEVGRLAGVPGDRIGQWARWGHIRASQSAADPHVYAFQDVGEAIVVHDLIDRGIALAAVRRAVDRLGGPERWPLSHTELHVVDGRLAVERAGMLIDVLGGWQGVLELDGRVHALDDLARGGWAARVLGDLEHVEVRADRLSGRPALRRRRIAAQDVAELAVAPGGLERLAADYGVFAEEIADARRWWELARSFERVGS